MFTVGLRPWTFYFTIGIGLVCVLCPVMSARDCMVQRITSRSGMITSPQGLTGPVCVYWQFHVENADTITISFVRVNLGTTDNCLYTHLKMGPLNERTVCGVTSPPYIARIRHSEAWIYFQTDDAETNSFVLQYIVGSVTEPDSCRPGEWRCRNGKCILEEWRCNNLYECVDHSDEDMCTHEPVTVTPQCGRNEFHCLNHRCIPEHFRCNGFNDCGDLSDERSCTIEVRSSTPRSWEPIFTPEACRKGGKSLRDKYGMITSPLFPHRYYANMDCSWLITNPNKIKVQLRFHFFRLQSEKGTDYVSVYDGPSESSPLIGTYYGSARPPPVIESTLNQLFVVFHSDYKYSEIGFNATYQQKGECTPDQIHCDRETECYYSSQRCDGYWNCPQHGSDELNCNGCIRKFSCGNRLKCYSEAERCNGKSFCLNNADELNCTSKRCGPQNGLFLCRNKRCIYESWECDRTSDCDDNSDEEGCPSPFFTRRVIVAAVAGSLICSLLLVIALGCICKVYALRMHEQYGPRHESPLSRLQAEFFRRRAPPPPYHEAMLTSRPYEEARREYLSQTRDQRRRRASDRRRNRALPPTPEEPTMHQLSNDSEQGGGNDVQLQSMNTNNEQNGLSDTSSTTQLIPPTTSSDSEENEESDRDTACIEDGGDEDDADSVLLDLSEGMEGSVTWRSRLTSDEEQSPERAQSDAGCDSLDSASASISVDDMSLALHETLDKQNGVEAEIVHKDNSIDPVFPATSSSTPVPVESCSTVDGQMKNQ